MWVSAYSRHGRLVGMIASRGKGGAGPRGIKPWRSMPDAPISAGFLPAAGLLVCGLAALSDPLPPDASYRPLPTLPLSAIRDDDEAQKPEVMLRQADLLNQRYD